FYELGRLALVPGIIVQRELDAVGDRRVVPEPEDGKPTGVGVVQPLLAEQLERMCRNLRRVGNQPVDCFKTKHVGLMLEIAAVCIACRSTDEGENGHDEQKQRQRGPIIETANAPSRSPFCLRPVSETVRKVKEHQEKNHCEHESFDDVSQHVVSQLVTEYKLD